MRNLPAQLNTKEIKSFIQEMISYQDAQNFNSLDETNQDKFVALCIRAFGCDVEIILGQDGNRALVNFLLSYDRDQEIEVMKSLRESAREQFSTYFDEMISQERNDCYVESMYEAGKRKFVDNVNGELIWI
jgi:hypothetical protein